MQQVRGTCAMAISVIDVSILLHSLLAVFQPIRAAKPLHVRLPLPILGHRVTRYANDSRASLCGASASQKVGTYSSAYNYSMYPREP